MFVDCNCAGLVSKVVPRKELVAVSPEGNPNDVR